MALGVRVWVDVELGRRGVVVVVGRGGGAASCRWWQDMHAARGNSWGRDGAEIVDVLRGCSHLVLRIIELRIVDQGLRGVERL